MENYVILNKNNNYNNSGNLSLSKKVFYTLGINSLNSVRAIIEKNNKQGIDLKNAVNVAIRNNRVLYKFNLNIDASKDEETIRNSITDIITTNLLIYCDIVPFDVDVRIRKIK